MKFPTPSYKTTVLTQLPIHPDFLPMIWKKECLLVFKEQAVFALKVECFHDDKVNHLCALYFCSSGAEKARG